MHWLSAAGAICLVSSPNNLPRSGQSVRPPIRLRWATTCARPTTGRAEFVGVELHKLTRKRSIQ
jgi:hypothetical protein